MADEDTNKRIADLQAQAAALQAQIDQLKGAEQKREVAAEGTFKKLEDTRPSRRVMDRIEMPPDMLKAFLDAVPESVMADLRSDVMRNWPAENLPKKENKKG